MAFGMRVKNNIRKFVDKTISILVKTAEISGLGMQMSFLLKFIHEILEKFFCFSGT